MRGAELAPPPCAHEGSHWRWRKPSGLEQNQPIEQQACSDNQMLASSASETRMRCLSTPGGPKPGVFHTFRQSKASALAAQPKPFERQTRGCSRWCYSKRQCRQNRSPQKSRRTAEVYTQRCPVRFYVWGAAPWSALGPMAGILALLHRRPLLAQSSAWLQHPAGKGSQFCENIMNVRRPNRQRDRLS